MFAISSDRLSISSMIAWVTTLVSALASGVVEREGARAQGAGWAESKAGVEMQMR